MSEPAAEMPISDAREQLTDVVNRAFYQGESTYITRRGRRLAVVASPGQLAADQARETQRAIAESCRQMWQDVATADEGTRSAVRAVIDRAVALAEDSGDVAVYGASLLDRDAGVEAVPWDQAKADLGL